MNSPGLERLLDELKAGATVLTANSRLSRHLKSAYDRRMAASGCGSWPTPEALPLLAWVASVWAERGDRPVIGGAAASALWERIVAADGRGGQPGGVAEAAYDAYGLVHEYGIALPEDIYLTEEARALKAWSAAYDDRLRRLGMLDQAHLFARVAKMAAGLRGSLPDRVVIAGFDELSPAVSSIIAALRAAGAQVSFWQGDEGGQAGRVLARAFADEADETVQAARWARQELRPGMSIGFVVPGLERRRGLIMREFAAELNPGSVLPGAREREVFNISLGSALSDEPLVRSALDALSMGGGKVGLELAGRLLRSPYFAGGEAAALARLDFALRKDNRTEISLKELGGLSARFDAPGFAGRMGEWTRWLGGARSKDMPGNWAASFTTLLRKAGWLVGASLSGPEFQAHKAWNSCLERLSSLGDIIGAVSRQEAASALASIARQTVYQAETPECNIQVMGLLESTGLSFDRLWIMGCHEHALPAEPSPNPFIPVWLQKKLGLPRSSSEQELDFARKLVKRLLASAPEVHVSWPLVSEQRRLMVSPFFAPFEASHERIEASSSVLDAAIGSAVLEEAPADLPLPVSDEEKAYLTGGTSILKNQSACPFRAFALHRLRAAAVPATEPGLKASARGDLIHIAMRLFWEQARDSDGLKRLKDSGGLGPFIEEMAQRAVKEAGLLPRLSPRFLAIEERRLAGVLQAWAEVEIERGVRFRVKALEAEKSIELGGLSIKGRVDRVDELEGGGEAVIDYKSGMSANRYDWVSERPRDPQLIVYCSTGGYDAVTLARLVPGGCGFVGIARSEGLPGVKPYDEDSRFKGKVGEKSWQELMAFWKETLEALASAFLAGRAEVDPAQRACEYCELPALCRIAEQGPLPEGEDDGDDDA